jgi:heme A synthase
LALTGTLLGLQIVWGAFVAGLKAGHYANTFPLMAGRLVPPGLLAYRPAAAAFVENPLTVQWTHRDGTALCSQPPGSARVGWPARRSLPPARHRATGAGRLQYTISVLTLIHYGRSRLASPTSSWRSSSSALGLTLHHRQVGRGSSGSVVRRSRP